MFETRELVINNETFAINIEMGTLSGLSKHKFTIKHNGIIIYSKKSNNFGYLLFTENNDENIKSIVKEKLEIYDKDDIVIKHVIEPSIKTFNCKETFCEEVVIKSELWDYDFCVNTCSNFIDKFVIKSKSKNGFVNKEFLIVKYNDNFKVPIDFFDFSCIQILIDENTLYQYTINGGDGFKIDEINKCFKIKFYSSTVVNLKIINHNER